MASNSDEVVSDQVQETQFTPASITDAVVGDDERLSQSQEPSPVDGESNDRIDSNCNDDHHSNGHSTADSSKPLPASAPAALTSARVLGPDLLRGLVMVLQAVDHAAVSSSAYSHGQAIIGEDASTRVTRWNERVGYTARTMTHLCAPAFMFLLGMGIVYFGRSRSRLGWTSTQMIKHFFVRALVLAFVNWIIGLMVIRAFKPMFNIVMLALAFNYFIGGLIWLAISWSEPQLAKLIMKVTPDPSRDPETNSLLHTDSEASSGHPVVKDAASQISFHLHNALLLTLSAVTIWWNIWLDPYHGHCPESSTQPTPPQSNALFEFFFHMFRSEWLFSGFPPLAWISPAIFGLFYARIVLSRPWSPVTVNMGNLAVSLTFMILFIMTRLLHFGNLDEGCLAMPEHLAHPNKNQYLASVRSFFYVTKYPPSPSYIFFAMGCNFLALALFGTIPAKYARRLPLSILLVFGTSALFFYTLHLPLYSVLGRIMKRFFGHQMDFDDISHPGEKAWGIGAGVVFLLDWLLGLLILWPACRWYGRFKAGKGADSIWRFF